MSATLTADDLLRGLLAALVENHNDEVLGTRPQIHKAFRRVLSHLRETPFADRVDLWEVDYDPLYGQSRWLDRALTRAQRGRMISFPNPTYERMQIRLGHEEAEGILNRLGEREQFVKLAKLFTDQLPSDEPATVAP
jgi:hypothetical protein